MRSEILIHPEELSKKWIDRMADAGITVLGIHPWGGKEAARTLLELTETLQKPDYRALLDYAAARGLEIEYEVHAAGYLMPRDLFDAHPDYFRMNEEGERVSDWNFCVSNTEAMELVARRAARLADLLYRNNGKFYFWMDDKSHAHCHCPKCRALSASDQQLTVINAMQREIRKTIPEAQMAYLAYCSSIDLPTRVRPDPGVFLEYAPFEKYVAKSENAAELIEREFQMIGPLIDFFGKENAKVLEYWYDNSLYSHWKKPPKPFAPKPDAIRDDIAFYRSRGFDSIATFGCFLGEDYEALYGEPDIEPLVKALAQ